MKETNALLAKIPNTKFKAMLSNSPVDLRHDVLWETLSYCELFSWDDLIAMNYI